MLEHLRHERHSLEPSILVWRPQYLFLAANLDPIFRFPHLCSHAGERVARAGNNVLKRSI